MITTIGYEKSSLDAFIQTLVENKVDVLVDIRDRAQSRKKGFSKTKLAEAVNIVGVEYLHVRALGDPKEGREAARAGQISRFRSIFNEVMESSVARAALNEVGKLAKQKKICLMCFEKDHRYCHRNIVSDYFQHNMDFEIVHLEVGENEHWQAQRRSVLYSCESATT